MNPATQALKLAVFNPDSSFQFLHSCCAGGTIEIRVLPKMQQHRPENKDCPSIGWDFSHKIKTNNKKEK